MTTIGSSNPYYTSLFSSQKKYGGKQDSTESDSGSATWQQPQRTSVAPGTSGDTSTALTGGDSSFGSKLSSALWSMESQGVEIDQPATDASLGDTPSTSVEDEFMSLAHKPFAQRIREQYLKSHDLTEDDLDAMSPDDRAAIEADIRKAVPAR